MTIVPGRLLLLFRDDVPPQGVHVSGLEQIGPRRHLVLAFHDRIDEPALGIGREFPQVKRRIRVAHPRAVAGRAILGVDRRALLDLIFGELLAVLTEQRRGERRQEGAHREPLSFARHLDYWSNNANVHTEPPSGRSGSPRRPEVDPPSPESTVTYCLPFFVQVIGWALMPEPARNSHSVSPVSASSAMNSPVCLPVNSRPPPVASIADAIICP